MLLNSRKSLDRMCVLYQILGTGTKWMLKRNCKSFCINQILPFSNMPLSSRSIFIRIHCIKRGLFSLSHANVKAVSSSETVTNRIVPKNVSLYHTDSPASKTIQPTLPNLDLQSFVDEAASVTQDKLTTDDESMAELSTRKALDEVPIEDFSECSKFIDEFSAPLPISFGLAAYVNTSPSLQKLVELGVDLSEIEDKGHAKFIQTLDFESDMKNHIQFLHDVGVPAEELGQFLTKNPLIFQEDLDNLRIRVNYLEVKKFSKEAIARIVTRCPLYLSLEIKTVDSRLGFLQRTFNLTGNEVRFLITKRPKLVPYKHKQLMESIFVLKETMGFSKSEMKQLLLAKPKIYMLEIRALTKRFDVVHKVMGISHEHILHFPAILQTRGFIIEQRHKYLVKCGRAQYDPTQPNYVSLQDLVTLPDGEFCRKCAMSSILKFNEFLKTL